MAEDRPPAATAADLLVRGRDLLCQAQIHRIDDDHNDSLKNWLNLDNSSDDCCCFMLMDQPCDKNCAGHAQANFNQENSKESEQRLIEGKFKVDKSRGSEEEEEEEAAAISHEKYQSFFGGNNGHYVPTTRSLIDLDPVGSFANSHDKTYLQESSSHNKYSESYINNAKKNIVDTVAGESRAVSQLANSHSNYVLLSLKKTENNGDKNDNLILPTEQLISNYDIVSSHRYRAFYNRETHDDAFQPAEDPPPPPPQFLMVPNADNLNSAPTPLTSIPDDSRNFLFNERTNVQSLVQQVFHDNQAKLKSQVEQNLLTTNSCDIEECLMQIEESLLSIEQNLLQVHEQLDLPELRNFLCNSPGVEKSLLEIQELLYSAKSETLQIKTGERFPLESDKREEADDKEEHLADKNGALVKVELFDANDPDANERVKRVDEFSEDILDDKRNVPPEESSRIGCSDSEKPNIIVDSLGAGIGPKRTLSDTKESAKLSFPKGGNHIVSVESNDSNLCGNSAAEKKFPFRDKCHNRTNSLDDNSTLQTREYRGRSDNLNGCDKAKSENTLYVKNEARLGRFKNSWKRYEIVESRLNDLQRNLEDVVFNCKSTLSSPENRNLRVARMTKSLTESLTRNLAENLTRSLTEMDASETDCGMRKSLNSDGRKKGRKSMNTADTDFPENDVLPSKLFSLSLSLLLAALLQAVRCLSHLVEDAFRSVSYDRNGLMQ